MITVFAFVVLLRFSNSFIPSKLIRASGALKTDFSFARYCTSIRKEEYSVSYTAQNGLRNIEDIGKQRYIHPQVISVMNLKVYLLHVVLGSENVSTSSRFN